MIGEEEILSFKLRSSRSAVERESFNPAAGIQSHILITISFSPKRLFKKNGNPSSGATVSS